ncbi:MAG: hypothetical protein KAG53_01915 [Endozoicomonadaceae bacterium]|nr:hypothetical protein [Endozoicomonadaceae bacterium]
MYHSARSKSTEMGIIHNSNHYLNNSSGGEANSSNDSNSLLLGMSDSKEKTTNKKPISKRNIDTHPLSRQTTSNPNLSKPLCEFSQSESNPKYGRSADFSNIRAANISTITESKEEIELLTTATHKKEISSLTGEKLDEFLIDMFFVFSKLENDIVGPITCKEIATGFFAYVFSTINLSGIVRGNYNSAKAWATFIVAGWSAGAMYSDALLSVIRDPVKLKDKIKEFKKLPKLDQMKFAVPMTVVCAAALYSPMLDAFNAHDGMIKLLGGDITDPSALHQAAGILGASCNWAAESMLPIFMGMRLLSGITADAREVLYADKDYHGTINKAAQLLTSLVDLYNQSIALNDNPNELILDVNISDIITFKTLLNRLHSNPYVLEDVIATIHDKTLPHHSILSRLQGVIKVMLRFACMGISGKGLSDAFATPSLLTHLGIAGKIDCTALLQRLADTNINFPLQLAKQHSYTVQGVFLMDNIVSFFDSFTCVPYAIKHMFNSLRNPDNEALTTNGLNRLMKVTLGPLRCVAGGLAFAGVGTYASIGYDAINGANSLAEATRCPNVTIPGIDEDLVNSDVYTALIWTAVMVLTLILAGGAPGAWMRAADRIAPRKKGPKAITLTEYQRRQKAIQETKSEKNRKETSHKLWTDPISKAAITQMREDQIAERFETDAQSAEGTLMHRTRPLAPQTTQADLHHFEMKPIVAKEQSIDEEVTSILDSLKESPDKQRNQESYSTLEDALHQLSLAMNGNTAQ